MSLLKKEKAKELSLVSPTSASPTNSDVTSKKTFVRNGSLRQTFRQSGRNLKKLMRSKSARRASEPSTKYIGNSNSIEDADVQMYESLQRCKVEHKAQQRFANFLTIDAASSESDVDKTSGRADSICSGGSLREWQKQFGRDMETRRKFLERYQSGALCCKASPASSCTTYKTNKSNLSTLLNDLAEVNEDQKEDQIDVISQIPPEPEPPRLQRDSVCVLPEKLKRKTPCVFPYVETVQIENIEFEEESKPIEVISITPEETKAAWSWKNAFCSCCERRRSDPLQAEHLLSRDTKARSYGSTTI